MIITFIDNFEVRCNNKLGHVIYNLLGHWHKKCQSENKEIAEPWKNLISSEKIQNYI